MLIQNQGKKQKGGFLSMLLGTLGVNLLRNILASKGAIAKREDQGMNRAGEGVIRAGDGAATKRQGRGIVRAGHENKMDF